MDLVKLRTELTTDPLSRGYASMGDEDAARRLNVVDRPGDGSVTAFLAYMLVNKSRTNAGADLVATSMLGRLVIVAESSVGTNLFGSGTALTLDMRCSAIATLEVVRNPNVTALPFQGNALQAILTDLVSAGVMRNTDRTALISLSDGQRSRAAELVLGGAPTASDVADARR